MQPSLGHRNTCLLASLASSSPGSSEEIEENSFHLVRGATSLKSPGVKELEIFCNKNENENVDKRQRMVIIKCIFN